VGILVRGLAVMVLLALAHFAFGIAFGPVAIHIGSAALTIQ
jgi:hypothetical protein